jgi:hypothetical protein
MMASQPQGIGGALKRTVANNINLGEKMDGDKKERVKLVNKAGESRSPYVCAHATNPVAWQIWGDEAIALARRENRLLFVSIGYSACHCKFSSPLFHQWRRKIRKKGNRIVVELDADQEQGAM